MNLLLDQGLGRSTIGHLAAAGVVAEHVGDLGLAQASDAAILDEASKNRAVVVTLDADFHQALAMTQAATPSVIRIRIEGLKGDKIAALLLQVLGKFEVELLAGAVVSVTATSIRARKLPIGG